MKTRVISGVVGIIIAIFAVMIFYNPIFDIVAFAVYAIAVFEIYRVFKKGNSLLSTLVLIILGGAIVLYDYMPFKIMPIAVAFVVSIVCVVVFEFEKIEFVSIASTISFALYVLFGIYNVLRLKGIMPYNEYGYDAVFMFTICAGIAWGGDIMAYFTGYLLGKHKMAPKLSPKKTIEGAIGGIVGSIVITLIMTIVYSNMSIAEASSVVDISRHYPALIIFAGIGSFVGIIGDLFASAVKRQHGIKDYGNIMPGHGGILDRFDSFLLVAPVVSLLADFIVKI